MISMLSPQVCDVGHLSTVKPLPNGTLPTSADVPRDFCPVPEVNLSQLSCSSSPGPETLSIIQMMARSIGRSLVSLGPGRGAARRYPAVERRTHAPLVLIELP
ncbi:Hypothetical protein NTJ_01337 [Nesidiocoris tenuis]|uniref:Uncharacterized protein n=1 Tax=Nesidiocoris tenuis TaxID=355587 RepID=A0ABN7ACH7_9HEMI|nr:Hypothetical protein NTJ_01337 [Nesidiocoris tenuis]